MSKSIAFFHEYFPKGGAERVTNDIVQFLSGSGYKIYLFVRELYTEKIADIDAFRNSVTPLMLPDEKRTDTDRNIRYIIEKTKELNVDVLIVQAYVLQNISTIKSENPNLKVVYCNHGMPFWEIQDKISRKQASAKSSFLKALSYYLVDIHKIYTFGSYKRRFINAYKELYDIVDAYVTLCDGYSKQIAETLKLSDTSKLFAINNSEKSVADIKMDKQNVVLFVGRLSYADKRADRLLDIWHLLGPNTNGWKLVIVGDGPEKAKLEIQASELGLENVEFVGYQTDTKKYYDIASILCMTSTFEGWGLVLTEAQANGVVPIAFGCSDGVKEILSPSMQNGIVVTPFDIQEYADRLLYLMNDVEARRRMQSNVIEKSRMYLPEVVGTKWIELLEHISG